MSMKHLLFSRHRLSELKLLKHSAFASMGSPQKYSGEVSASSGARSRMHFTTPSSSGAAEMMGSRLQFESRASKLSTITIFIYYYYPYQLSMAHNALK
jgi:hypothetical protein